MIKLRLELLMMTGGIGSILLGLPYINRVFGTTEAEVVEWGLISRNIGLVITCLSITIIIGKLLDNMTVRVILGIGYASIALMQIPPIIAWFLLSGHGISDSPVLKGFKAHWSFAAPHILIFFISILVAYVLINRNKKTHLLIIAKNIIF